MKESNSFEDVVKRVLVEKKKPAKEIKIKKKQRSKYVSEAMAGSRMGGTGMPSSVSKNTTAGGAKGMPPFAQATADRSATSIDMRDIGKEEDRIAKSHGTKPYPLNTTLDYIVDSGDSLFNAYKSIEIALNKNNVTLSKEQKEVLKQAKEAIDSSVGNIKKATFLINSISLKK